MTIPVKVAEATIGLAAISLIAMSFTPSELTAITIAIGALFTSVLAGIANIITALRTERKVDRAATAVSEVSAKADVITGHVNSAATASTAKIDAMQKQIDQLTRLLSETKTTAAVLAQSAADIAARVPPAP